MYWESPLMVMVKATTSTFQVGEGKMKYTFKFKGFMTRSAINLGKQVNRKSNF